MKKKICKLSAIVCLPLFLLSITITVHASLIGDGRGFLFNGGNPTYSGLLAANAKFKEALDSTAGKPEILTDAETGDYNIGDVNGDNDVDLADAILALRVIAGLNPAGINSGSDVNIDGKVGVEEAIYIFQVIMDGREIETTTTEEISTTTEWTTTIETTAETTVGTTTTTTSTTTTTTTTIIETTVNPES